MNFDPTIHYGDVLQAIVMVTGGFLAFVSIQFRLNRVEGELRRLVDISERTSRMDERLIALSGRVGTLEASRAIRDAERMG